jgi:uncharacterized protein (DUF305 family)
MKKTLMSVAFAVVAVLTVAGCGSDTDSAGSTGTTDGSAQFNDADVAFAQSMIPHHQQAVEMATMAQDRASSPEVKQLAAKIKAAQGPEIATLTGWLEDWGQEASPGDSMGGMDHSGSDMSGMMSDADMKKLGAATGTEFDQMFLEMMIKHHAGAIEMAKTEQQDGENPDAIALAKKIEADQTAEIAQMEDLLGS